MKTWADVLLRGAGDRIQDQLDRLEALMRALDAPTSGKRRL